MKSLATAESSEVEATQAPGTGEDRNPPPEAADEGPDDERGRHKFCWCHPASVQQTGLYHIQEGQKLNV